METTEVLDVDLATHQVEGNLITTPPLDTVWMSVPLSEANTQSTALAEMKIVKIIKIAIILFFIHSP